LVAKATATRSNRRSFPSFRMTPLWGNEGRLLHRHSRIVASQQRKRLAPITSPCPTLVAKATATRSNRRSFPSFRMTPLWGNEGRLLHRHSRIVASQHRKRLAPITSPCPTLVAKATATRSNRKSFPSFRMTPLWGNEGRLLHRHSRIVASQQRKRLARPAEFGCTVNGPAAPTISTGWGHNNVAAGGTAL
jgi:hypothetical protein